MNPDGKGSWPLHLGSAQRPDLPGFMAAAARWREYRSRDGPGLWVEPCNPSLPGPTPSAGLSPWWPWRVFLLTSFGVLCPLPVCFIMVEASQRAVEPSCSAECMELGTGMWEGSSNRLSATEGVVDFTKDLSTE